MVNESGILFGLPLGLCRAVPEVDPPHFGLCRSLVASFLAVIVVFPTYFDTAQVLLALYPRQKRLCHAQRANEKHSPCNARTPPIPQIKKSINQQAPPHGHFYIASSFFSNSRWLLETQGKMQRHGHLRNKTAVSHYTSQIEFRSLDKLQRDPRTRSRILE